MLIVKRTDEEEDKSDKKRTRKEGKKIRVNPLKKSLKMYREIQCED